MKTLEVNDTIKLHGGYDYDPIFLQYPPNKDRIGKVLKSIPGQNEESAFVVKLDFPITAKNVTGDILVMELRYEGQTWQTNGPVHLELCDFIPEDKQWKDRKQGIWIESHASFDIINNTFNSTFYAVSAILALVLAIFLFLLFIEFLYPFNIVFGIGCLLLIFSPLGERLLKKYTNYIRVYSVATLATMTAVLIGIAIPLNIAKYYDRKAAFTPEWIYDLKIYSLWASIIIGFILSYMIFKKYYRKQEKEE